MGFARAVLLYFLQFLFTLVALLLITLIYPLSFFQKKKKRDVPPSCLIDPSLGDHHYVTANGIKFHYVSNGDNSKPLMLLLHGYPEFWFSWRNQLKFFSNDYHVVAIDLKGYGETDKPADKGQYAMDVLVEDIVQLVKVLSPDQKCILVGHDWGGAIAWMAVQKYPELFDKLIAMNCPHPKLLKKFTDDAKHLMRHKIQILNSWYVLMFQTPLLPEILFSMHDYEALDLVYKSKQMGLVNRENFTDDVLEAYKHTFSGVGALTPPINYYRNVFANFLFKAMPPTPIDMPTLLIWGESEPYFDASFVPGHNDDIICTNITIKRIPNCSHWVQQDCPELTNQYMKEFLEQ